jgi:hypothetical protein
LLKLTCPHLSEAECAAYEAPFPDIGYKAGVRRFPEMVPDRPDAPGAKLSRKAREWLRKKWTGQVFMAIGMRDPVLGPPVMQALRKDIRNCPVPYEPDILYRNGVKRSPEERWQPLTNKSIVLYHFSNHSCRPDWDLFFR